MNGDFITKLYGDMETLYHLDQIRTTDGETGVEMDNRELPAGTRVLLVSLAGIWILIGIFKVREARKQAKKNAERN